MLLQTTTRRQEFGSLPRAGLVIQQSLLDDVHLQYGMFYDPSVNNLRIVVKRKKEATDKYPLYIVPDTPSQQVYVYPVYYLNKFGHPLAWFVVDDSEYGELETVTAYKHLMALEKHHLGKGLITTYQSMSLTLMPAKGG